MAFYAEGKFNGSGRQSSVCLWDFKDFSLTGHSEVPGSPKHLSPWEGLRCPSEGTLKRALNRKSTWSDRPSRMF